MKLNSFFLDQHGCAKNQVDGELLVSHLIDSGKWQQTFNAGEADLIIINSCGFIESAKTESINAVLEARSSYPKAKIILAGCLAERYGKDLKESLKEADGIFGNGKLEEITDAARCVMNGERYQKEFLQKGVCGGDRKILLSFPGSAYVKITEGCNNRCSFCAIPLIRGNLRSRNAQEIISEIKSLIDKGVYEINLIGQDLAAYGTGAEDNAFGDGRTFLPAGTPGCLENEGSGEKCESGLARLLKMISRLSGTFIVRLLYIHPDHFNADILDVMKSDSRFLPYFDIPFQSGDDEIIPKMNRTGSRKKYSELIKTIRNVFPEAAIRTTFMAGFPGEKEENFLNTVSFLEEIKTDWSGCFSYSREDDTPAFDFKPQVSSKISKKRAEKLVEIQGKITEEKLKERAGKEYDILIEEVLEENHQSPAEGLAIGRAWFQAPEVDGSVVVRYDRSNPLENNAVKMGRIVRVFVSGSGEVDLNGDFVCDSPLNKKIKENQLIFAQSVNC